MEYIKRAIEDIALNSDKSFKSVLITGARQTGKTEMIKKIFPKKKYVLIDDPFIEDQANNNPNMPKYQQYLNTDFLNIKK